MFFFFQKHKVVPFGKFDIKGGGFILKIARPRVVYWLGANWTFYNHQRQTNITNQVGLTKLPRRCLLHNPYSIRIMPSSISLGYIVDHVFYADPKQSLLHRVNRVPSSVQQEQSEWPSRLVGYTRVILGHTRDTGGISPRAAASIKGFVLLHLASASLPTTK